MAKPDNIELIERAQQGDTDAFCDLVYRYQDLVAGTAYGWLGDAELARDVTQEVFLEAHLKLDQLQTPAAFAGWLRRIVIKQCDRLTRRRSLVLTELEDMAEPAAPASNPGRQAEVQETADHLRFAVESLPVGERQVVALHYFAEASGPELADYLDVPLSTIKKRLRRARARLKEQGERLMENTIREMRPSRSGSLSKDVRFFIALRAGDRTEVSRLLRDDPSLADARQAWEPGLVLDGLLPFANQATALITAVEQDDLEMLRLLLASGADVNGMCGCETSETPLWAATLFNRLEHARCLLRAGADPNLASSSGNYPLHLAAMRGHALLLDLLLEYGADASLADAGPKFPMPFSAAEREHSPATARVAEDWALANGHTAIAARLRQVADDGQSPHRKVLSGSIQPLNERVLISGIKAVDLFAPIERGGVVRVPFKAGVGMVVLLGELCHRFSALEAGAAVWTGFAQPPFDLKDWEAEMAEFGLVDDVAQHLASFNEPPEVRRQAFARGVEEALSLSSAGRDVLVIVQATRGFEGEVEAGLLRLSAGAEPVSITTIVITDFPVPDDVQDELRTPYTAQLKLHRARARQYLFPALDPQGTTSRLLEEGVMGERHQRLAGRARALLQAYEASDPQLEHMAAAEEVPAVRLMRYLCQPFFVTEPFTGSQGEWVGYDQMLEELTAILEA